MIDLMSEDGRGEGGRLLGMHTVRQLKGVSGLPYCLMPHVIQTVA